jgi:plasmid maintenance system antidote protein VapI
MSSDMMNVMGKAGQVLRQVLEDYSISQTKLATVLGIGRSNVYRWVNEVRDPNSETVLTIVKGLEEINPQAAEEFKKRYMSSGG